MKWKGFLPGVLLVEMRVGKKAVRKARGYWVWISGLLVGAPRALGGGEMCETVFEVVVILKFFDWKGLFLFWDLPYACICTFELGQLFRCVVEVVFLYYRLQFRVLDSSVASA